VDNGVADEDYSKEVGLDQPSVSEKLDNSSEKNETWLGRKITQDISTLYLLQETR